MIFQDNFVPNYIGEGLRLKREALFVNLLGGKNNLNIVRVFTNTLTQLLTQQPTAFLVQQT